MNRPFKYAAVLLVIINGIFPALWLLLTSFKTDGELRRVADYLPAGNLYVAKLRVGLFRKPVRALFCSIQRSCPLSLRFLCVLVCRVSPGYALGRLNMPGTPHHPDAHCYDEYVFRHLFYSSRSTGSLSALKYPFLSDLFGSPHFYAEPAQHLLGADYPVCRPQLAHRHIDSDQFLSADSGRPGKAPRSWTVCTRISALFRIVAPVSAPRYRYGGDYRLCQLMERVFCWR